jgi:hypothetical protein
MKLSAGLLNLVRISPLSRHFKHKKWTKNVCRKVKYAMNRTDFAFSRRFPLFSSILVKQFLRKRK